VDALGYRQLLDEFARQPDLFLGALIRRDGVSFAPLTSVFPSTTVNATTTLNTGAQPAEHGILGYTLWLPELGGVSEMIRFGPYAGPWAYREAGVEPAAFQPAPPLDARLREVGVATYTVSHAEYAGSALTRMQYTSAEYVPHLGPADLVVRIRQLLERPAPERMLIGAYYGTLDALCHLYGAGTSQQAAEVAALDGLLRRELFDRVRRPDTLFMLLADHGHINVAPERNIDLVARHPALLRELVVPPTGEGRARYLHARGGRATAVRAYIAEHFGGIATVLDAEEALARGLFGAAPPIRQTRERIGDFVLLPHENWYFHHYPTERLKPIATIGRHGGLTPEELLAPFLALRLG
jgi:predicted AlkP superfamily pyrophosphatase or phosphodiesterase